MKEGSLQLMLFEVISPVAERTRAAIRAVMGAAKGAVRGAQGVALARAEQRRAKGRVPRGGVGVLAAANDRRVVARPARPRTQKKTSAKIHYDVMVRAMLAQYNITVRKWRTSMSGVAYELRYRDGSTKRMLESPRPRSPLSAAIFLHEVGHHAIGLGVYKPRCLEEYHAWMYSLDQMRAWNIEVTEKVQRRVQRSLKYAVGKATRRGIKALPEELLVFAEGGDALGAKT